ncbi:hypothetical protein P7C70_g7086, partial [Phenoliferia sp. Uapishka_3]
MQLRKSRVPQFLDVQAWRRNSNAVWGDYYSSSGTQDQVPNRSLYFLFQREQLFQLGTGFRVKYGALLDPDVKPVFRTESQDRMLKSALNFAAGFFGIPYEEQYHQLITLEWPGLNNTLSPYSQFFRSPPRPPLTHSFAINPVTCKNANRGDLNLSRQKLPEWIAIYLKDALVRLQAEIEGFELTLADLFNMQQMAAYEVVALGGSRFGDIFTEEEWEGFEYGMDLLFWYGYSFGNPAQAAVGLGWVQEWLARVTRVPIIEFNSTTNSSYHTSEYFPFNQKIYVDATHDTSLSPLFCHPLSFLATNAPRTVISAIITTLNFASFASSGPLPSNFVPKNRSFDTSRIAPFAANLVSQIMSSPGKTTSGKAVRWLLNDGVVPLDHIEGCGKDGLCDLDVFVEATRNAANEIDWAHDCLSPYTIEEGDAPILDGRPPKRK